MLNYSYYRTLQNARVILNYSFYRTLQNRVIRTLRSHTELLLLQNTTEHRRVARRFKSHQNSEESLSFSQLVYVCCSSLPLPIKGLPLYTTAILLTVHGFLPVRYLKSREYISSRNDSFQHYFALHGNTISAKRILQCLTRNIASLQALCLNGVCRTDPSITPCCKPYKPCV